MLQKALDILKILDKHGFEGYIIGGYPRDSILNIKTEDIDLCTNATPEDISDLFYIKKQNYGSMVIEYKNVDFEITTYRREEGYQDHRRPKEITFVSTLMEDLSRRDFIINTLAIDKDGKLVDLLGAKEDIKNKMIRMIGDPFKRLEEDSLRILRAIRLQVILDFKVDETLKEAILENRLYLTFLSKRRVYEELQKMFCKNKTLALQLLREYKIDEIIDLDFIIKNGLDIQNIIFKVKSKEK